MWAHAFFVWEARSAEILLVVIRDFECILRIREMKRRNLDGCKNIIHADQKRQWASDPGDAGHHGVFPASALPQLQHDESEGAGDQDGADEEPEDEEYFCPECGAKITIDMTECPNCGIGLSFEEEDEE